MKNVLISSLGESPAVVTETVDALKREENIEIHCVITVSTNEWTVQLSQDVLMEEFNRLGIRYYPYQMDSKELLTEEEHLAYLHQVATLLYQNQKNDVYLSLAGGRKTMSALLTIAAQIYGAKMLCHIVPLDEELERDGEIRRWSILPREEQQRVLHPPSDKVRLVRLPLVSLFPLLDEFLSILRGDLGEAHALQLLESSRLVKREGGQIKRTASGEHLFKILSDIKRLPSPSPLMPEEKEIIIHDHGYAGNRRKVVEWAKRLAAVPWVVSVRTIPYGRGLNTGIRKVLDDGRIEVDVGIGGISAGLEVRTTAQGKGQTERVAEEINKIFR